MTVKLRPIADFTADFPDDQEDDGENIIVYGGRGVAEHVAAMLGRLDYDVSVPAHTPPYGWRFDVQSGPGQIVVQITDLGDEFVLGTWERTRFLTRLFNRRASIHAELLTKLHRELSKDGRFHRIQWWDRYDARGTAADEPVPG